MQLRKLSYSDSGTRVKNDIVSERVEFFFHYWISLFDGIMETFDPHYLKSHRSILAKVRLQIEGNFKHAKKYIKLFLSDDDLFKKDNIVMQKIKGTPEYKNLNALKRLSKKSNGQWDALKPKPILKKLERAELWLKNEYPALVAECLHTTLEKNTPLEEKDQKVIKQLVNCFIVDLYIKGFQKSYIRKLPEYILTFDNFPFEQLRSDFPNDEAYLAYKQDTFSGMTLQFQVNALLGLLARQPKTRTVIFRIYDVNSRIDPVNLLGVEFYNPNTHPKINLPEKSIVFIEENFTDKSTPYEYTSRCNACITAVGIQDEQIYQDAWLKLQNALPLFNKIFDCNGKAYHRNAIMTNADFNIIWGSTSAMDRGFSAIDEITPSNQQRVNKINGLSRDNLQDNKLLNFIGEIASNLKNIDAYAPEKIWMILEATFGIETTIKKLCKDLFKIYIHYNLFSRYKTYLTITLNSFFSWTDPDSYYELSNEQCRRMGLTNKATHQEFQRFKNNYRSIADHIPTSLISDILGQLETYQNDPASYFTAMDNWIDRLITELNIQRNLTVHSNMGDQLFLLKKDQLLLFINLITELFLNTYLGYKKRRSIEQVIKAIAVKAAAL